MHEGQLSSDRDVPAVDRAFSRGAARKAKAGVKGACSETERRRGRGRNRVKTNARAIRAPSHFCLIVDSICDSQIVGEISRRGDGKIANVGNWQNKTSGISQQGRSVRVPAIRHGKASIAAKTEKRWNGPGYSLIEESPKKTSKMLILSCAFFSAYDQYSAIVYTFRKLIFLSCECNICRAIKLTYTLYE